MGDDRDAAANGKMNTAFGLPKRLSVSQTADPAAISTPSCHELYGLNGLSLPLTRFRGRSSSIRLMGSAIRVRILYLLANSRVAQR